MYRRPEVVLQDGLRLAELASQASLVQAVEKGMRHRVAADLHAGGRHLAQLRPGDEAGRPDEGRHHEERRAQTELDQRGEGLAIVAGAAVVEGEAEEAPAELLRNLRQGDGSRGSRLGRHEMGAELPGRKRIRPVRRRHLGQMLVSHDVVETEDGRARPHT